MKSESWIETVKKVSGAGVSSKASTFQNKELESKFVRSFFLSNRSNLQILSIVLTGIHFLLESQMEDLYRLYGSYVKPGGRMSPIWHGSLWTNFDPNNTAHVERKKIGDEWQMMQFNLRFLIFTIPVVVNIASFLLLFTRLTKNVVFAKFLVILFWFVNIFGSVALKMSVQTASPYANIPIIAQIIIWYSSYNSGLPFLTTFKFQSCFFFIHSILGSIIFASISEHTSLSFSRRISLIVSHLTPFIVGVYALRTLDLIRRKSFVYSLVGKTKVANYSKIFLTSNEKESEEEYNKFFNKSYFRPVKRYSFVIFAIIIANAFTLADMPVYMLGNIYNSSIAMVIVSLCFLAVVTTKSSFAEKNLQKLSLLLFFAIALVQNFVLLYFCSQIGGDNTYWERLVRQIFYSTGVLGVIRILQHGSSSLAIRFKSYVLVSLLILISQYVAQQVIYNYYWPTMVSVSTLSTFQSRTFRTTCNEFLISSTITAIFGSSLIRLKEVTTRDILAISK